ncbi:hypothetical protein OsI_25567 [Oryza sativa Indica Group]|uniref:Uncharacterized protein n=1 Tax=Oryza sativa subsp. indica TaxID=39946 RepID=B8B512_ORYSI|nr:hypothetical protein OsI_25567 [Oryza sativa Indica Group]
MVVVVTVDSVSSSLDSSTTGAGSTSSEHPRPPEHRHRSHHCLHEPPHRLHPSSSPLPSVGRKEEAPDLLPVTPSPRAVDAESHQHRFRGLVALDPPSQGPPTPDPPSRGPPAPYPLPRTSPLVDAATVEAMAAGGSGKERPEKGGRRRDRGTSERRVWYGGRAEEGVPLHRLWATSMVAGGGPGSGGGEASGVYNGVSGSCSLSLPALDSSSMM